MWWAAQTCNGDKELLVENFLSVLQHICNIHLWQGNAFKACEHEPIKEQENDDIVWLSPQSYDFQTLKGIIEKKEFLKDI